METLSHCGGPVCQRLHERLSDIIRVNVVHGLVTEIRERHFASRSQIGKHLGIKVAGRVDRHPSGTDEVTRMQYRHGKTSLRFRQQVTLNLRLAAPIYSPNGFRSSSSAIGPFTTGP
jgi:hypothetical protein